MREGEAMREEQLRKVAQAQLVAKTPHDNQEDNVSRELKIVKGRARRFIELPSTG